MDNPYIEYYSKQAGSGISGFAGSRYHKGNGFFGKILKNIKPALKYIGRQGWEALKSMSSDVMSGKSFGEAGTNSLINTAHNVINDASSKIEKYKRKKQTGGGKRKKRKIAKKVYKARKPKRIKKKVKKKTKRKVKRKPKKKAKLNFF